MQIVEQNSTEPADCELQLVAKDGVYMPAIPRKVDSIILPSGARGELLVGAACRRRFRRPIMGTLIKFACPSAGTIKLRITGCSAPAAAQVRCNKAGAYTVTGTPSPHPFGANFSHPT